MAAPRALIKAICYSVFPPIESIRGVPGRREASERSTAVRSHNELLELLRPAATAAVTAADVPAPRQSRQREEGGGGVKKGELVSDIAEWLCCAA